MSAIDADPAPVTPTLEQVQALVGHRFPGGTFTIAPWEHWLFADAVLSPPLPEGIAHPIYVYRAAMAGMGLSIQGVFDLCMAHDPGSVMFGESGSEVRVPLRVGATYQVRGGITSVERRQGRRAGVFDLISFELEIVDSGGAVAALQTNSWVFMRGVAGAA